MSAPDFEFRVVASDANLTKGRILLSCPLGLDHGAGQPECAWPLSSRPAANGVWQWDGNVEKPSITPSIWCQRASCGRHFVMTKGEI